MDNLETIDRIDQARYQLDFIISILTSRANQYVGMEWSEIEGMDISLKDISGKLKKLSDDLDQ